MDLSICITIKNRFKVGEMLLFPRCVDSIFKSIPPNLETELIITDWQSTDVNIINWLEEQNPQIPVEVVTIKSNNQFSAGKGRNIAADKASGEIFLFLDTDILVNQKTIEVGYKAAKINGTCYPTIMYQKTHLQPHYMIHTGGGILFIQQKLFELSGGWPEYEEYGFEDVEFTEKLKKIVNLQTTDETFIHMWHPAKMGWPEKHHPKKQHYKKEVESHTEKEIEMFKKMLSVNIDMHTNRR